MKKTQYTDILKNFRSGNFSEAINSWANELKKDALNESIHQSLIKAKDHLEQIQKDDTSKKLFTEKISALQSFFDITLSGKFRESKGEKSAESPVSGMKETADGDIVISDDFNHRIQIYDKDYELKLSFGQKGKNPGEFYYPKGIDIDTEGNIYVADCWNHRIQKFTKDGKFISTFGNYGNEPSQFHEPVSITVNNNQILVADRCNHRIQFFDGKGNYQGSLGHRGRTIEENLAELFETPPDKFSIPSLEFPSDIAIDSKNDIYIADSHNHRVLKFNSSGNIILSFGKQGKEHGEFLYPQSITIDRFDNIFISDLNNNRIQLFSPAGDHCFSFSRNGSNEPLDSPTILTCGKDNSLFCGFAFNPKISILNYGQITQKERYILKEKFIQNSADSSYFSGNFFHREQSWTEATRKYEEALSIISANGVDIIPELPLVYLSALQEIQKKDISAHLLSYYDKEMSDVHKSILDIYQKRKDVTEKLTDPILKDERNVIEEKLTSGEIDKNLYKLNNIERDLFRKTRETFLELKRMEGYQRELFLQLLSKMLSKHDNDGIKTLIQKSLFTFYQQLDLFNRFLSDHDKQNSKCFEEIQRGTKGSFNLIGFRLAYELTEVAEDFIKLSFPILKSSIHLLSQLALKMSTSKSGTIVDLFASLTEDKNIQKMGSALFKLRYDFEIILQFNESLRVLFSYLKLNSDEIISNILSYRSCDKGSLLDKDKFNYEKDLMELLFVEEMGIGEKGNGLGIGLYCFNDSDLDSFQSQVSKDGEEQYTDLLNNLQKAIDQLLSEKKELDKLILKHETNLKSIHPGDQKSRLQITNEYNLVKAQSAFGNKLILEHFFLYRIINFKRCVYLLMDSELKRRTKNESRIKEIYHKINTYSQEISEILNKQKVNMYKKWKDTVVWLDNLNNATKSPSETDRAKEIDSSNKLFQLYKDTRMLKLLQSEYKSIVNVLGEIERHLVQKVQSELKPAKVSESSRFHHDLQFGFLGNNSGQFNLSRFLCTNIKGDILVADTHNHRIQKFDSNGNHILTFGSFGDLNGFFNKPEGIVCDDDDNFFVCDSLNHRVQKFDSNGKHLLSWGTPGDKRVCFKTPYAICHDKKGFFYITDIGNHRIQKFTPDGQFVLSFEMHGKNNGESFQYEVICNHNDTILVGDFSSDRIQVFGINGNFIKSFNYSEESSSNLQGTTNISIDKAGYIYISDFWNNKIYVLSNEYRLITSIGSPGNLQNRFDTPCGVAFTGQYMFLCDYLNHRIHRFYH